MNNFNKFQAPSFKHQRNTKRQFLFGAWMLAMGVFLGISAYASSTAENFNITNLVINGASIIGYPTNTPSTNAGGSPTGVNTGGAISVKNQEWAGFQFSCLPFYSNGAAGIASTGYVQVMFVRAANASAGVPQYATGSNTLYQLGSTMGTNQIPVSSDWETSPMGLAVQSPFTLQFPVSGTNPITYFTNFDRNFFGGAQFVGIWSITNTATNLWLTNCTAILNKKIIPITYP